MTKCSIAAIIFLLLKEKLPQAFMQIGWMYVALLGGTVLQIMMSQQYNSIMELYTNVKKFNFSWKYIFPLLLYLGMVGLR